jgi:hypothetical protein
MFSGILPKLSRGQNDGEVAFALGDRLSEMGDGVAQCRQLCAVG